MKSKSLLIIFILIGAAAYGYYYYFVQTLMLSQIIDSSSNPLSSIVIGLIDFDTGLTRYDVHNLSEKASYWESRIQQVNSIQDYRQRNQANEKLLAEMMEDPSMRKVVKKLFGFGMGAVGIFFKALH